MRYEFGNVVQFNEKHKWFGSIGIITEVKRLASGDVRYMICVPIPQRGNAYIFSMESEQEFEFVGEASYAPKQDREEEEVDDDVDE